MLNHNINKSPTSCCNIQAEVSIVTVFELKFEYQKFPQCKNKFKIKPQCGFNSVQRKNVKQIRRQLNVIKDQLEMATKRADSTSERKCSSSTSSSNTRNSALDSERNIPFCFPSPHYPGTIEVNSQARILLREADQNTQARSTLLDTAKIEDTNLDF